MAQQEFADAAHANFGTQGTATSMILRPLQTVVVESNVCLTLLVKFCFVVLNKFVEHALSCCKHHGFFVPLPNIKAEKQNINLKNLNIYDLY